MDGPGNGYLLTGPDAAGAHDALVIIPLNEGVGIIDWINMTAPTEKRGILDPILITVVLESAVSVLFTGMAAEFVPGRQQFQDYPPGFYYIRALGFHHHAVFGRSHTGGQKQRPPFDFHQAHPAGTRQPEIGIVTEGGNLNPVQAASLQEGAALGGCYPLAVNS